MRKLVTENCPDCALPAPSPPQRVKVRYGLDSSTNVTPAAAPRHSASDPTTAALAGAIVQALAPLVGSPGGGPARVRARYGTGPDGRPSGTVRDVTSIGLPLRKMPESDAAGVAEAKQVNRDLKAIGADEGRAKAAGLTVGQVGRPSSDISKIIEFARENDIKESHVAIQAYRAKYGRPAERP